jgi:hypothetical protein
VGGVGLGITGVRVWLLTGAGGCVGGVNSDRKGFTGRLLPRVIGGLYSRLSGCFRIFAAKANWSRVYYFGHKRFSACP